MKRIVICALMIFAAAASDSRAEPILCKQGFSCPIVASMSDNGSEYGYSGDTTWFAKGPWGSGGATITIYGNIRCSATSGDGLYWGAAGNPSASAGQYCWCQMRNGSFAGPWVFQSAHGSVEVCMTSGHCTGDCGHGAMSAVAFRSPMCSTDACDGTTIIADGACPAGYAPCAGSQNSSNAFGSYTVTCSE
jgi:hypothetical protein